MVIVILPGGRGVAYIRPNRASQSERDAKIFSIVCQYLCLERTGGGFYTFGFVRPAFPGRTSAPTIEKRRNEAIGEDSAAARSLSDTSLPPRGAARADTVARTSPCDTRA